MASSVALKFGTVLLAVALARTIGASEFGVFAFGLATAILVASIMLAPLGTSINREVASGSDVATIRSLWLVGVAVSIILGISVGGFLPVLAQVSGMAIDGTLFTVGTIAYTVVFSNQLLVLGMLNGSLAFRAVASMHITSTVVGISSSVLLGSRFGAEGALLGAAFGLCCGSLVGAWHASRLVRLLPVGPPGARQRVVDALSGFALPAFFSGMVVAPVNWFGLLWLSRTQGDHEVGIFQGFASVSGVVSFLPTVVGIMMLPRLASRHRRGLEWSQPAIFAGLISLGVCFTGIGLLTLFTPLATIILGDDFVSYGPALSVVAFGVGLAAYCSNLGQVFAAAGKMWQMFWCNAVASGTFIIVVLVAVPRLGLVGLALANVIEYLLLGLILLALRRHFLGTNTLLGESASLIGLAALAGITSLSLFAMQGPSAWSAVLSLLTVVSAASLAVFSARRFTWGTV